MKQVLEKSVYVRSISAVRSIILERVINSGSSITSLLYSPSDLYFGWYTVNVIAIVSQCKENALHENIINYIEL